MIKMKVKYIRSDGVYQKIANASIEKKNDIYRYELMMPFKKKWDCYSVPMKASTPNGYDVIMASSMLGLIAPNKVDKSQQKNIEQISSDLLWTACQQSIQKSLDCLLLFTVGLMERQIKRSCNTAFNVLMCF